MKFIFSRTIIGILVLIIGSYILLQYVFHIYIPALAYVPVFTIIVSILIIAWGVAIILGRGFYASKIIIALTIIVTGLYILIRYALNINMPFILYTPIFRMIIGMIIIFLGIYIIVGVYYVGDKLPKQKTEDYTINFRSSTIDLSDIQIDRNKNVNVNCTFADTVVLINQNIQIHIKASSAFGSISIPTGDSVSFGEMNFVMGTSDKILYLNVNAAFAQIRVLYV